MSELSNLESLFTEFLSIYRVISRKQLIEVLNLELNDEKIKYVYQLSDGEKSSRDIANLTGVNYVAVTKLWKQWALSGIVIPATRKGRYKYAFDLVEYGLSVIPEEEK